ncbi:MAG: hypothetical protein IIA45_10555 [Bacteroidetes bacterium]|nr:hypothetical protein [Bacteroidota bacterium]
MQKKKTGTLIILAWPDSLALKIGMWYDRPMKWLGFNKNDFYKVGHAAIVLVNHETGHLHYFDFGRYHTPEKQGRVRDELTDPDIIIREHAMLDEEGHIYNLESILLEIASNKATHGTGKMVSSVYSGMDFKGSFAKAKEIQSRGAVNYGPFDMTGTNCSRFVATVAKAGILDPITKLLMGLPYTLTPTPIFDVKVISNKGVAYEVENNRVLIKYNKMLNIRSLDSKITKSNEPELATSLLT